MQRPPQSGHDDASADRSGSHRVVRVARAPHRNTGTAFRRWSRQVRPKKTA